jgi:hypothetical protein
MVDPRRSSCRRSRKAQRDEALRQCICSAVPTPCTVMPVGMVKAAPCPMYARCNREVGVTNHLPVRSFRTRDFPMLFSPQYFYSWLAVLACWCLGCYILAGVRIRRSTRRRITSIPSPATRFSTTRGAAHGTEQGGKAWEMKFIDGLTLTDRDTRKTSNIFFSDCQIAFSSSTRLYPPLIERHQPRLSQRVTVASCKSSATAYTGRDGLQKGTQHRVRTSRRPWQPISRTRYMLCQTIRHEGFEHCWCWPARIFRYRVVYGWRRCSTPRLQSEATGWSSRIGSMDDQRYNFLKNTLWSIRPSAYQQTFIVSLRMNTKYIVINSYIHGFMIMDDTSIFTWTSRLLNIKNQIDISVHKKIGLNN